MTQPVFGTHTFTETSIPNAQDAFDLVTSEVLQHARETFPERAFLVDENVQAVADRIHGYGVFNWAQKRILVQGYAGLWIIVAFTPRDHLSRFGMEIVTAQTPAEKNGVKDGRVPVSLRYGLTCIFDTESWGEKLASLAIGSPLTVMGQIEQLNANEIRLRHCEII